MIPSPRVPPCEAAPEGALRFAARQVWERGQGLRPTSDCLVAEEPLEIRLCGAPVAVVMRTPGHDEELGAGFAVTERLVHHIDELVRIGHCTTGEAGDNVLLLTPRADVRPDLARLQRRLYTTSSCGICGKQSIAHALETASALDHEWTVGAEQLARLPQLLRDAQPLFALTGGLHAAALFGRQGDLLVTREDIGRHNAVDKCIGWALLGAEPRPLQDAGLVVSGRVSFEIVQKALAAGVSLVAGVGAVSSLAVELARRAGVALVGFTSAERLCVYAGEGRIL